MPRNVARRSVHVVAVLWAVVASGCERQPLLQPGSMPQSLPGPPGPVAYNPDKLRADAIDAIVDSVPPSTGAVEHAIAVTFRFTNVSGQPLPDVQYIIGEDKGSYPPIEGTLARLEKDASFTVTGNLKAGAWWGPRVVTGLATLKASGLEPQAQRANNKKTVTVDVPHRKAHYAIPFEVLDAHGWQVLGQSYGYQIPDGLNCIFPEPANAFRYLGQTPPGVASEPSAGFLREQMGGTWVGFGSVIAAKREAELTSASIYVRLDPDRPYVRLQSPDAFPGDPEDRVYAGEYVEAVLDFAPGCVLARANLGAGVKVHVAYHRTRTCSDDEFSVTFDRLLWESRTETQPWCQRVAAAFLNETRGYFAKVEFSGPGAAIEHGRTWNGYDQLRDFPSYFRGKMTLTPTTNPAQ
jgi:hypothetical protein